MNLHKKYVRINYRLQRSSLCTLTEGDATDTAKVFKCTNRGIVLYFEFGYVLLSTYEHIMGVFRKYRSDLCLFYKEHLTVNVLSCTGRVFSTAAVVSNVAVCGAEPESALVDTTFSSLTLAVFAWEGVP